MVNRSKWPSSHVVWCFGGFLFPIAFMAVSLGFERGHSPSEAEITQAIVHPDVYGLAVGHFGAALISWGCWPMRGWVIAATLIQLAGTLYWWFLAGVTVQGTWL
jgi:hypothetical protein